MHRHWHDGGQLRVSRLFNRQLAVHTPKASHNTCLCSEQLSCRIRLGLCKEGLRSAMLCAGRLRQAIRPAPRTLGAQCRPLAHNAARQRCRAWRPTVCAAAPNNHYEVLGVTSSASDQDIKRAFRQLALKLHPDVNKTPGAEESFKACAAAYEILGDPRQRAQYDAEQRRQFRTYSQWGASTSTGADGMGSRRGGRSSRSSRETVFVWEDVEEEDEDDQAYWGFNTWASTSQSSWKANSKKRARAAAAQAEQARQAQQQQQQQQQQGRRQYSYQAPGSIDLDALVAQLDPATLAGLKSVFGSRLQKLHTLDELVEFLAVVELLQEEYGIEIDGFTGAGGFAAYQPPASGGPRRGSSRGSRPSTAKQAPGSRNSTGSRGTPGRSSDRSVTLEDLEDLMNSMPSSRGGRRGAYNAATSRIRVDEWHGADSEDDTSWAGWASTDSDDDDSDDEEDGWVAWEELTPHDVHVFNSMHSWFGNVTDSTAREGSSRGGAGPTGRRRGGSSGRRGR